MNLRRLAVSWQGAGDLADRLPAVADTGTTSSFAMSTVATKSRITPSGEVGHRRISANDA